MSLGTLATTPSVPRICATPRPLPLCCPCLPPRPLPLGPLATAPFALPCPRPSSCSPLHHSPAVALQRCSHPSCTLPYNHRHPRPSLICAPCLVPCICRVALTAPPSLAALTPMPRPSHLPRPSSATVHPSPRRSSPPLHHNGPCIRAGLPLQPPLAHLLHATLPLASTLPSPLASVPPSPCRCAT